jgi:hypothetical protein
MNMFIKALKDLWQAGEVAVFTVLGLWTLLLGLYGPESLYLVAVFGPIVLGISFLGALFCVENATRRDP